MSPKNVLIKCPQCQRLYIDWLVATIKSTSVAANSLSDKPLGAASDIPVANTSPSSICSKCGHRTQVSDLSERDGVLQQLD